MHKSPGENTPNTTTTLTDLSALTSTRPLLYFSIWLMQRIQCARIVRHVCTRDPGLGFYRHPFRLHRSKEDLRHSAKRSDDDPFEAAYNGTKEQTPMRPEKWKAREQYYMFLGDKHGGDND